MSAARFGSTVIEPATSGIWYGLFSGTDGVDKTAVVNFCLQSDTGLPAYVYLAYITDDTLTEPTAADIILYKKKIVNGTSLQFGPLAVGFNGKIAIKVDLPADTDSKVSINAYGFQE